MYDIKINLYKIITIRMMESIIIHDIKLFITIIFLITINITFDRTHVGPD